MIAALRETVSRLMAEFNRASRAIHERALLDIDTLRRSGTRGDIADVIGITLSPTVVCRVLSIWQAR